MSELDIETIRRICKTKDIGYSQSSNQFTSYSVDRVCLQNLLNAYDKLREENHELRKTIELNTVWKCDNEIQKN